MFVQNDRALNPIGAWGCYFTSLGKIAEDILGRELTAAQVLDVYADSVCGGVMGWNCFVKKPDAILGLYLYALGERGHVVKYIGWWNADMPSGEPVMWGAWKQADVTHEVTRWSSGSGHHFMLPDWNPWPELTLGGLTGRRLLSVVLREEEAVA